MTDKMTGSRHSSNCNGRTVLITIIATILLLSLCLMSCSILPDSDLGEYTVPNTYTTYTDKSGLFSISYPPDWNTSYSEDESASLIEYLNDNDSPSIPETKYRWVLFIARNDEKSTTMGDLYLTAFSIARRFPLEMTREQIYNAVTETKDYKPFLQEKLRIAGREVAIFRMTPGRYISVFSAMKRIIRLWSGVCES